MEVNSNRIGDVRSHYRRKLGACYPEREADALMFMVLGFYTGHSKASILMAHEERINESQLLKIHFAVKQLLQNKPIQYVLEETEFYGLRFKVNSRVLIPRPETEELVEKVLKVLDVPQLKKVLDIGTGSGNIAITIASKLPQHEVHAIDVSSFALDVAKDNAKQNLVDVYFKQFDILELNADFPGDGFDVIVANPPYVRNQEKVHMKPNVLEYEPALALFVDDNDPLIFYKAIAIHGKKILNQQGEIYAEINQYLGAETKKLFEDAGYKNVELIQDINGNDRIVHCVMLSSG